MTKNRISIVLFAVFLLASTFVQAQDKNQIEALIKKSRIPTDRLGLVIGFSGSKNDLIYNLNGQKKMIPASLTKIMTAAAALEKLPLGHKFETSLLSEGAIKNGVLKGNLYLKGGGDAGFVSESLWNLVNQLTRSEVTSIEGDIVVDDTYFDSVRFDDGRDPARNDEPYDAPIGAMSFNWSAVSLFARPAAEAGAPAKVFADPQSNYIRIVNKTKTVKGRRSSIAFSRRPSSDKKYVEEILATGEIGIESPEVNDYRGITQPDIWAGHNLVEFLKQRGISVSGRVRSEATPKTAKVITSVKSKPVADQVRDMMKYSNNFVAEMLTKNIAAYNKGGPGTMPAGLEIIREHLQSFGVKDFELTSPSGLSRRNSFYPNDIFNVLSHIKQNFKVYPEFLASFPIMGIDGTLRKKSGDSPSYARVRAKTGHLTGIAGLAGFLGRDDEKQITFVFIYNGEFAESARARDLFDQILDRLSN